MSLLEQVGMMQISSLYIYWTMKCLLLLSSVPFIDCFLLFSYVLLGLFFVQRKLTICLLILHSSEITDALCYYTFHSISSYLSSCLSFIHSRDTHNLWNVKVHYHICPVLTHFHKPVTTISILILSFQLSLALASCCSLKYLYQNCECTSCLSYACSIRPGLLDLTCLLHFLKH